MRAIAVTLAALALLGTSAFAQDQTPAAAGQATSQPADPAAAPPPADAAAPAAPATPAPPANPPMTGPKLLISTSMGDMLVQLDTVRAPKSAANVLRYAREKHYDGTVFYRVQKGFVIQLGSWDAKGHGRPIHKETVPLEAGNGLSNYRGALALAHGDDPNSAAAEFFIDLADNTGLDRQPGDAPDKPVYAVFGQVISGLDVMDAIAGVPVGDGGPMPGVWPQTPVVIRKMAVIPEGK